jgi:hypothetical protein
LFGNLELRSPRWNYCEAKTFSPLLGLLNERVSPERLYLETKWGSLISFELAADLLKDTLPVAETVNAAGVSCSTTGPICSVFQANHRIVQAARQAALQRAVVSSRMLSMTTSPETFIRCSPSPSLIPDILSG